jgi:hypothetical protein
MNTPTTAPEPTDGPRIKPVYATGGILEPGFLDKLLAGEY